MDSQNPNNLPVVFKKIPNNIKVNNNSPEEQEFAIIYSNGKVDYFVRCGNWGFEEDDRKYLYQRITFKVDKNFYNENYNGIGEFKDKIKDNPIKQIYVEIYNPKKESLYDNWDKKEAFKKDDIKVINNITCGNIFDAFENATYEIYTKNMCNFLASAEAHKEAFECQQSELGKNLDLIRKTGSCHVKDLAETEQKEYLGFQHKNIKLEKENNELKSLLGQLRNENIQFQNDLYELNGKNLLLEKEKEKFEKEKVEFQKNNPNQNDLINIQNEKDLLKKGWDELKNEKDKFEKEKVEFQKNNPNQNNLTNIQKENDKLKNENNQLKIDNGQLKGEKILLEKKQKKLQKDQKDLENAQNQLKDDRKDLEKDQNELKGEKILLEKKQKDFDNKKTQVDQIFKQDYVIRKEGLFDCCCGPAYSSLEEAIAAAQAEKEPAIEN